MERKYIIKDAREILSHELENLGTKESASMCETILQTQQVWFRPFPKTARDIALSIKWIVPMVLDL